MVLFDVWWRRLFSCLRLVRVNIHWCSTSEKGEEEEKLTHSYERIHSSDGDEKYRTGTGSVADRSLADS